MYYAKKEGDQVVRCNIADHVPIEVFTNNPTEEQLAQYGVVIVHDALSLPDHNPETHGLVDIQPELGSDGKYRAKYEIVEITPPAELPPNI